MNDDTILKVLEYMDENLFEPKKEWSKDDFRQQSYARWAAGEIIQLITDRPFTDIQEIIDAFILKIFCFSHLTKADKQLLLCAIEVAEELQSLRGDQP